MIGVRIQTIPYLYRNMPHEKRHPLGLYQFAAVPREGENVNLPSAKGCVFSVTWEADGTPTVVVALFSGDKP